EAGDEADARRDAEAPLAAREPVEGVQLEAEEVAEPEAEVGHAEARGEALIDVRRELADPLELAAVELRRQIQVAADRRVAVARRQDEREVVARPVAVQPDAVDAGR